MQIFSTARQCEKEIKGWERRLRALAVRKTKLAEAEAEAKLIGEVIALLEEEAKQHRARAWQAATPQSSWEWLAS